MIKVVNKNDQKEYEVFHIRNDKTGYPHFLIFQNNQWIYKSAKLFIPTYEFLTEDNNKIISTKYSGHWTQDIQPKEGMPCLDDITMLKDFMYQCSECGKLADQKFPYCPFCGTSMEEVDS